MTKAAVGIDIGGTKISIVAGTQQGKILAEKVVPTKTGPETRQGIQDMLDAVGEVIRQSKLKKTSFLGIGAGVPGPVNSRLGVVPVSPHLKSWKGLSLKNILGRKFRLPVVVANDANAAALGEKIFGEGRDVQDFIYMTVSTGIGGGIVVRGELIEGSGWVAGEVGHMTLVPNGELCKCGKRGCLEAYASGTAIARVATHELEKMGLGGIREMLTKDGPVTAQKLGLLARRGDPVALKIYEHAGEFLGIGMANLLNILNPQKVILGGGVLKSAPPVFLKAMRQSCQKEAWPEAFRSVKIVPSKLRGRVGDLGALALVFHYQR